MNEQNPPTTPQVVPPGLITSITSGFNSVAGNIYLILFPLLFDLLLWFGPHLRLQKLVQPFIDQTVADMAAFYQSSTPDITQAFSEMAKYALEHFNLVTALHTLPVGIPSLLLSTMPILTPLGNPPFYELSSLSSSFFLWVGLSLSGLILGSWYFFAIASKSAADAARPNLGNVGAVSLQTLMLAFIMIFFIFVLFVPATMILYVFAMINPLLAQISMMVMGLLLIWMLIPFVFSPHGIFTHQLSAVKSILVSLRLVRRFLPGTGVFILILLLVNYGLNNLWNLAPETSWMMMVGIVGHAFISTAVISATFFYYRSGIQWMQAVINRSVDTGLKA